LISLTPLNARTADEARALVRQQKAEGVDFIKIGIATPEVFFAAQEEARRIRLAFAGHLQPGVDAAVAAKAGMKAIEHLGPNDTVLVSCSSDEVALREAIAQRPAMKLPPKIPFLATLLRGRLQKLLDNPAAEREASDVSRYDRIAQTFSERKCRALADVFVASGTWHVPTLIRMRTTQLADLPEVVQRWHEANARYDAHQTVATKRSFQIAYELHLRLAKLLDDAGVQMLAGSDESGAWEVPGFSLHQEFDELARGPRRGPGANRGRQGPLRRMNVRVGHRNRFWMRS
jgi:hypothetical protein